MITSAKNWKDSKKKAANMPVSIVRCVEPNRTQYAKTEHIVPETGMNMLVYHLVLQISDSERHKIAMETRK